ncbi:hypothetical protein, partial [Pseudomonas viridiflava]|uniref:hypothetical protein n=1 Tax=Pseudomonas viridiflava TaxID=33069 RepID=UPI0013CE4301
MGNFLEGVQKVDGLPGVKFALCIQVVIVGLRVDIEEAGFKVQASAQLDHLLPPGFGSAQGFDGQLFILQTCRPALHVNADQGASIEYEGVV